MADPRPAHRCLLQVASVSCIMRIPVPPASAAGARGVAFTRGRKPHATRMPPVGQISAADVHAAFAILIIAESVLFFNELRQSLGPAIHPILRDSYQLDSRPDHDSIRDDGLTVSTGRRHGDRQKADIARACRSPRNAAGQAAIAVGCSGYHVILIAATMVSAVRSSARNVVQVRGRRPIGSTGPLGSVNNWFQAPLSSPSQGRAFLAFARPCLLGSAQNPELALQSPHDTREQSGGPCRVGDGTGGGWVRECDL